jgi:hypothetical protein
MAAWSVGHRVLAANAIERYLRCGVTRPTPVYAGFAQVERLHVFSRYSPQGKRRVEVERLACAPPHTLIEQMPVRQHRDSHNHSDIGTGTMEA